MNSILKPTFQTMHRLPSFLDTVFPGQLQGDRRWTVPVNIIERKEGVSLEFSVPGISKEDIRLSLEHGHLEVSYSTKQNEEPLKYRLREFEVHSFQRRFKLGEHLNAGLIEAKLEQGILIVFIPYSEQENTGAKQIEILG
ncbi:MAG: Hsp20/alpha crystallin family protein [Bacteroidetes bacterium]|jgi:HSP20 family protein|nr:Hsp20/alpha crystallin family protein [Bacteroidota bacterium]